MAENTAISWADHTWSPWYGCTQVSMGAQGACEGCYARFLSETRHKRVVFGGPGRGEGSRDVRADSAWLEPPRWNRKTPGAFVFPSMCDPFDNHPALVEPRRRFFDLIRATPNLTWLLLTKRPGNIVKLWEQVQSYNPDFTMEAWPRNAAIGCTVVSQDEADRDIPKLLAAKAALKPAFAFLSMEPLLAPVDLTRIKAPKVAPDDDAEGWFFDALTPGEYYFYDAGGGFTDGGDGPDREAIDWVIAGGETDQGAHKSRPSHPDWFRSLRDQCGAAEVPFHFKQWGEWREAQEGDEFNTSMGRAGKPPAFIVDPADGTVHCFLPARPNPRYRAMLRVGSKAAGRLLDGVTHDDRPVVRLDAAMA